MTVATATVVKNFPRQQAGPEKNSIIKAQQKIFKGD